MYTVTYKYQDDDTGLWHYAEIPCKTLDEAEAYEAWAQEMDNIDQDSICIESGI